MNEVAGNMEMQPVDPNKSLSATLTAEQWNAVLGAVSEMSYRAARPIIDALIPQLRQQSQPDAPQAPDSPETPKP